MPFDLRRYVAASPFFELARLPTPFEADVVRAVAVYRNAGSHVDVINVGTLADGQVRLIQGRATVPDAGRPADLRVTFPGARSGQYLVEAVSEDYGLAVVGNDNRQSLWILARRPCVTDKALQRLVSVARKLGYPVDRLRFAPGATCLPDLSKIPAWDQGRRYEPGDYASVGAGPLSGGFFVAIKGSQGVRPGSDGASWRLVAQS